MTSTPKRKKIPQRGARHTAAGQASRPRMPRSYGLAKDLDGTRAWSELTERLATSRNYWIGTTRPDGRPHAMPVWGVWFEETFYFATDRSSQKGRNLGANPELIVHLESGEDVVVLEGVAEEVTNPANFTRIAEVYEAKYQWRLEPNTPGQVTYALRPRVAFAWLERSFTRSASRWVFR